jgi:hypothetical protein
MRKMRKAYKILVGRPERKKALGWPQFIWKYYIKMDLGNFLGVNLINLAQDRGR